MPRQKFVSSDPADYIANETVLKNELRARGNDANWYSNSFNPYPMVISPKELKHQQRLQSALQRAIRAIVENFPDDERLHRLLSVPAPVAALIKSVRQENRYEIGSFRPDFLHDTKGGIKICEINARFPTNGYYISHYLGLCIPDLNYISKGLARIETLDGVVLALSSRFKPGSKIAILKGREKGWDIHFFKHELAVRGFQSEELTPESCDLARDSDGYVLELHQDELIDRLDTVFDATDSRPGFNDIRTIFLVHDKRLLAVLHEESIMADYLAEDDRLMLRENVAESYVVSCAPAMVAQAKTSKLDWIIKPNLLGKGEGMLIGASLTQSAWESALNNPAHGDFVLQRFVQQEKFPILLRMDNCIRECSLNVVGTLLGFDEHFLGTGIYRASQSDIVNVAGGGAILFPMLADEEHNE